MIHPRDPDCTRWPGLSVVEAGPKLQGSVIPGNKVKVSNVLPGESGNRCLWGDEEMRQLEFEYLECHEKAGPPPVWGRPLNSLSRCPFRYGIGSYMIHPCVDSYMRHTAQDPCHSMAGILRG